MSALHTPGPLFVSVDGTWPFNIVTKDASGEVVFTRGMPCYSTKQTNAAEALAGKHTDPEWDAVEHNARALADEVLRAAAPELLEALRGLQANPNDPRAHRVALDATSKAKGGAA